MANMSKQTSLEGILYLQQKSRWVKHSPRPSTCKNARWEINIRSMSNSLSIEINLENTRLILDNLIFLINFSRVNLTISMLKSLTTLCFTVLLQTIYGKHHMQQCMLCLFFLRYRNKIATFKLINSISIYFN